MNSAYPSEQCPPLSSRQVEQALRESEERYRRMADNIQDGLFIIEAERVSYVNQRACQIFGASAAELLALQGPEDLAAPEERPALEKLLAQASSSPQAIEQLEYWIVRPDGSRRCVHNRSSVYLQDGICLRYVVCTDVTDRKCMEEALRKSEAKSRALLRAIPDLMVRLNHEGVILECYAPATSDSFSPFALVLGRPLRQVWPSDIAQPVSQCLKRCLITKQVETCQLQYPTPAGALSFELRHVASGEQEVLLIVRNITEQKQAERALIQSESNVRRLIEEASDAVASLDAQDRWLSLNQRACEMLGYAQAELTGRPFWDLVPLEAKAAVLEQLAGVRQGETRLWEQPLRHKSGELREFEISAKAIGEGRIQGIARDITERKSAEQALRRSEQSFRTLIEKSPDVIAAHRKGKLVFFNQRGLEVLGYENPEELVGRSVLDIVYPEDRALVQRRIEQQLATGQSVPPIEERMIRKDGQVVYADVTGIPLDFQGQPAIIVVAHDVTDRKRAEEERRRLEVQIQHAQKLESLGVLAGGIAHDFNNLLMGVLGNAGLALMELGPESPGRGSLQRIETAALRAAELTNQLLAYSGKGRFVVQPLNLSKLVEEMVHLLQTVISKKAILRLSFVPNLPLVEADATQLRQVIMNLITNASDAIGQRSGVIVITTGVMNVDRKYLAETVWDDHLPEGCYVYVEVSDTGCGMDGATLSKIFDPFFTTKFTGRGLGLAAALGIVRGHRGAIKVHSEPQRGTRFRVLLPSAIGAELHEPAAAVPSSAWRGEGTVLVIDDDETVRSVAELVLERFGFQVLGARDGEEGVELFRDKADSIALVLLDMTMPRMSGEEAFREIQAIRPNVPVILSSGYSEQEAIGRFAGQGLAGFIQKPYPPMALIDKVRAALGSEILLEEACL